MNIASLLLTILAILSFGAGAYFTYDSRGKYLGLKDRQRAQEGVLVRTQGEITDKEKVRDETNAKAEEVKTEVQGLEEELAKLRQDQETAAQANAALKTQVDGLQASIDEVNGKVQQMGNLDDVISDLQSKQQEIGSLETELAASTQQIGTAEERFANYDRQIDHLQNVQRAQQSNQIYGGLSTSVRVSIPEDGLVIINGGYNRGVVPGATFNFERGGSQVATGKVSAVHAGYSVVRLDRNSAGDSVYQGDRAVSVQTAASDDSSPPSIGSGRSGGSGVATGQQGSAAVPPATESTAGSSLLGTDPAVGSESTAVDPSAGFQADPEAGGLPGEQPADANPFGPGEETAAPPADGAASSSAPGSGGGEMSATPQSTNPFSGGAAEPATGNGTTTEEPTANPFQ